ncbi:hypothetical protein O181_049803 [Austropuccinia psidii MF-1]|uniref:Integrase catalytic domain-containing protein n=1 Tax=Austropuccinia psidii MF-1 TaxID=1389203 RepID=A0A9Q3E0L8_9BASI|nr:hypothetical protein [Austropuccinia psidii MF-1]
MTLCSRLLINTILHECHDSIYSGPLSEDITLEKLKSCAWWPSWRRETIEYFHTCDRCQKANRTTGKKFGLMIHIQEPKFPCEVVHMDWVTALPQSGDKSYNPCLVIVDRYSKTPIFLPCHKDDTTMDTALLLSSRVISHTGLFKNIISDRAPKFTSALWNNLHMELSGELENKHPTFPVSLIKPYQPADKELFPLRNPTPLTVPLVEQNEDKKKKKFIKERRLRGKNQREYLVRYINPVHEDEWLAESEIPDSDKLLRRFRHERRPQA